MSCATCVLTFEFYPVPVSERPSGSNVERGFSSGSRASWKTRSRIAGREASPADTSPVGTDGGGDAITCETGALEPKTTYDRRLNLFDGTMLVIGMTSEILEEGLARLADALVESRPAR